VLRCQETSSQETLMWAHSVVAWEAYKGNIKFLSILLNNHKS